MATLSFLLNQQAQLQNVNTNSIEAMQPLLRSFIAKGFPGNKKLRGHGPEDIEEYIKNFQRDIQKTGYIAGVESSSEPVFTSQGSVSQVYRTPLVEWDQRAVETKTSLENQEKDVNTDQLMLSQAKWKLVAYEDFLGLFCKPSSATDDGAADDGAADDGADGSDDAGRRKRRKKRFAGLIGLVILVVASIGLSIYNAIQISAMGGRVNEQVIKLQENISSLEEGLRGEQLEFDENMNERVSGLELQLLNLTKEVENTKDDVTDLKYQMKDQYKRNLKQERRLNNTIFLTTVIELMKNDMRTLKTIVSPEDFEMEYITLWDKMAYDFILSSGLLSEKLKESFGNSHHYLLKVISVTRPILLTEDKTQTDYRCSSNYIGNLIQSELPYPDPAFPVNKTIGKYLDISGKNYIWINNQTFLDKTEWRAAKTISRQRRIATHATDGKTTIVPMNNTWILVSSDKNISAVVKCDHKSDIKFLHPASHTLTLKLPLACSFESEVLNISKYYILAQEAVATPPTPKFEVYYNQNLNLDEMAGLTEEEIDRRLSYTHTDHNNLYNSMMADAWQHREDTKEQIESMRRKHAAISERTFEMIQEEKKEHENNSIWRKIVDYFKGLGQTATIVLSLGAIAVLALPVACISWKCVKSAKSKSKGPQQSHTIVVTTPPSPNMLGIPPANSPSISYDPTAPPPYTLHTIETELNNQDQLPQKTPGL